MDGQNGQLLRALSNITHQLQDHSKALQELQGKDGIAKQKKDDDAEVKMMFKQLLEGQIVQKRRHPRRSRRRSRRAWLTYATRSTSSIESTSTRLDGVATKLTDFNEKMKAMEKKVEEL